jgi:hypothetical protein
MLDPDTLYLRLYCFHVPNAILPQDLRGDLQAMPPRRSIRRQGVPVPIHHRRVPALRRTASVPAVRGLPRSA